MHRPLLWPCQRSEVSLTTVTSNGLQLLFGRSLFLGAITWSRFVERPCDFPLRSGLHSLILMTMKTISVSEAKSSLSEQIRRVQKGGTVVITDRGRPVARLVGIASVLKDADWIVELEREGLLRRPIAELSADFLAGPRPNDSNVLAALLEDREDRL